MLDLIKLDKARIEKTRTLSRIHLSGDAARKLPMEIVEEHGGDYDPVSSNGRDTLLGLSLVVNPHQTEDYLFEDVLGQKITPPAAFGRR